MEVGFARQTEKKLSQVGLGFDVASISGDITISFTVPIFQDNLLFGKRNDRLSGDAITKTDYGNLVKREIKIPFPLDDATALSEHVVSIDPYSLELDQKYAVCRETPLMPHYSPTDPVAAMAEMKIISVGGTVRILATNN